VAVEQVQQRVAQAALARRDSMAVLVGAESTTPLVVEVALAVTVPMALMGLVVCMAALEVLEQPQILLGQLQRVHMSLGHTHLAVVAVVALTVVMAAQQVLEEAQVGGVRWLQTQQQTLVVVAVALEGSALTVGKQATAAAE
jgi:hypothetical protein